MTPLRYPLTTSHVRHLPRRAAMTGVVVLALAVASACTGFSNGAEPAPVTAAADNTPIGTAPASSSSPEASTTAPTAALAPEQAQWVEAARPVVDEFFAVWSQQKQQPRADVLTVRADFHGVAGQELAGALARGLARDVENGYRLEGEFVPRNVQFVDSYVAEDTGLATVQFDYCEDISSQTIITSDGRQLQPFGEGGEDDTLPDQYEARVWVQDVGTSELPGLPQGWVVTGATAETADSWTDSEVDPCFG